MLPCQATTILTASKGTKLPNLRPKCSASPQSPDVSTISRALRRDAHADDTYRPVLPEASSRYRHQRAAILGIDKALRSFVVDLLAEGWTSEQITGWFRRGIEIGLRAVSHDTIHTFIFRSDQAMAAAINRSRRPDRRRHPGHRNKPQPDAQELPRLQNPSAHSRFRLSEKAIAKNPQ